MFKKAMVFLLMLVCIGACSKKKLAPIDKGYPESPIQLPRDLAAHDWAQTEWWYYTGHLETDTGARYGFELTFFKRRTDEDKFRGIPLRWFSSTGYMAHFSVIDESTGEFVFEGLSAIGEILASTDIEKYDVRLDKWSASGDENSHRLNAEMKDASIDLELKPAKPAVLHGDRGIVNKGQGMANYYISYTRLVGNGTLKIKGRELKVRALAWFDHEYGYMGSTPVDGWDWYSIQLDDNTEYMIYAIRRKDGSIDPMSKACRIDGDGVEECLPYSEIEVQVQGRWRSPHTGGLYPSGWSIKAPQWGLDIVIFPTVADQEFRFLDIAYWEGSCNVIGKPANGHSYIELVGYSNSEIMKMTADD